MVNRNEDGDAVLSAELPIKIRKACESDVPFIFSSWLKSYRDSHFARSMTTTIYYTEHHKVIERLLRGCQVYVAVDPKDDNELYGYICAEIIDGIFVLHYVYTKHTYRNLGLAKQLLNVFDHDVSKASMYTHHSKIADKLAEKYRMVHSSYLALTPDYRREEIIMKKKVEVPNE